MSHYSSKLLEVLGDKVSLDLRKENETLRRKLDSCIEQLNEHRSAKVFHVTDGSGNVGVEQIMLSEGPIVKTNDGLSWGTRFSHHVSCPLSKVGECSLSLFGGVEQYSTATASLILDEKGIGFYWRNEQAEVVSLFANVKDCPISDVLLEFGRWDGLPLTLEHLVSIGVNYPNAAMSFYLLWSDKKIGAIMKQLPARDVRIVLKDPSGEKTAWTVGVLSIMSGLLNLYALENQLLSANLHFLHNGTVVEMNATPYTLGLKDGEVIHVVMN